MIYQNLWRERRIPTWLSLLILTAFSVVTVIFLQRGKLSLLRADPAVSPSQVEITNITQNSFTISWITSTPATGVVRYGENSQTDFVARDIRDNLTGELGQYQTHWVAVTGLNPNSSYSFKIISQGHVFDNKLGPYMLKTAPLLPDRDKSVNQISGRVVKPDGSPADGALIYLRSNGLSTLSTIVEPTGNWMIDQNLGRTLDLSNYYPFNEIQHLKLTIISGNQEASVVSLLPITAQPLPEIILNEDYDFRTLTSDLPEPETQSTGHLIGFDLAPPDYVALTTNPEDIVIWSPVDDQEIASPNPLFLGRSPAETELTVNLVDLSEFTEVITSNSFGDWQWSPAQPLEIGKYTFEISYSTTNDVVYQDFVNFSISPEATQSADLAPNNPTDEAVLSFSDVAIETPPPTFTPVITQDDNQNLYTENLEDSETKNPALGSALQRQDWAMPAIGLSGLGLILVGIGVVLVL